MQGNIWPFPARTFVPGAGMSGCPAPIGFDQTRCYRNVQVRGSSRDP